MQKCRVNSNSTRRRLRLADIDINVDFVQGVPAMAPILEPFCISDLETKNSEINLIVHANPCRDVPQLVVARNNPAHMTVKPTGTGRWFQRLAGHMWASPDFTQCQTWGPSRTSLQQKQFDGRPWLMLAVWGYLSQRQGTLLHGAICTIDNHYILLLGDQQVGKSTLARLIVQAGHACLTDEYAVSTWTEGRACAHGTPWPGVTGNPPGLSGPLRAIFFLKHASSNVLEPLNAEASAKRLLANTRFFVWDPNTTLPTIELLDRTARTVPIYEFGFAPTLKAVEVLQEVL